MSFLVFLNFATQSVIYESVLIPSCRNSGHAEYQALLRPPKSEAIFEPDPEVTGMHLAV